MEMKKGFVYTLESVIASTLILTMVIVVLPEAGPELTPDLSTVDSGLETAEVQKSFDTNLTNDIVSNQLDSFVPESFNHSNVIYKSKNNLSKASADEEIYMNGSGRSADIQLWISSPNNLNITFDSEKLIENLSSSGYYEKQLPATEGWLNFSGTGDVEYSFNTYQKYGKAPLKDRVYSKNSLSYHKRNREVQIHIWQ